MLRWLIFTCLLISASAALGANWAKLGTDSNGITAYFDGSSFRKAGPLRYYKVKYVMPNVDATGMIYTIRNEVIDCNHKMIRILTISGYRADDSLIGTVSSNEQPREALPGSNGGEMVQGACSL